MGHVWEWQLNFQIRGQLPITEITLIPTLPPPPFPKGSQELLTLWVLLAPCWPDHPSGCVPDWLNGPGWFQALITPPLTLSPKEEWENARLKLPMVTGVTDTKAVFHGGIDPFQTCPPGGFHRSSISLNSNKKEIFSLHTNQHYFGEVEHCVCQQCSPYKLLIHFQKGREGDSKQGGGWLREPPEVFSNLNFPCDPLDVRNGLGFIFIL